MTRQTSHGDYKDTHLVDEGLHLDKMAHLRNLLAQYSDAILSALKAFDPKRKSPWYEKYRHLFPHSQDDTQENQGMISNPPMRRSSWEEIDEVEAKIVLEKVVNLVSYYNSSSLHIDEERYHVDGENYRILSIIGSDITPVVEVERFR